MSPELEALARRAIACKGWRWVPGQPIVDSHGVRGYVVDIAPLPEPGAWVANRAGVAWLSAEEMGRCLPDLTDPGTLGCLLSLVREVYDCPIIRAVPRDDRCYPLQSDLWTAPDHWIVWVPTGVSPTTGSNQGAGYKGATEAEALVVALEAAP